MMQQESQYTNIAFISYKRNDAKWKDWFLIGPLFSLFNRKEKDARYARWLQRMLEYYRLPAEIIRQHPDIEFSTHPRHVFRDATDLCGGNLSKAIKEGLDSSKFLVVICSPRSAKSKWVNDEVQEFIDSGREEFIIPFILEGEPYAKNPDKECYPVALKNLNGKRNLLEIRIDNNGRNFAAVKIVAHMFGLKLRTLWDRFLLERRRKRVLWSIMSVLLALIFSVAGLVIYRLYEQKSFEENEKRTAEARELVSKGKLALSKGEFYEAMKFGIKAVGDYYPYTIEADTFLSNLNDSINNWGNEFKHVCTTKTPGFPCLILPHPFENSFVIVSEDDDDIYRISLLNANNGVVESSVIIPEYSYQGGGFSKKGNEVYVWSDNFLLTWNLETKYVSSTNLKVARILGCNDTDCLAISKEGDLCLLNPLGNIFKFPIKESFKDENMLVSINSIKHHIAFVHRENCHFNYSAKLKVYNYQSGKRVYEKSYNGVSEYPQEIEYIYDGSLSVSRIRSAVQIRIYDKDTIEVYHDTIEYGCYGLNALYSRDNLGYIITDNDSIKIIGFGRQTIFETQSDIYNDLTDIGLTSNNQILISIYEDGTTHIYRKQPFVFNKFIDFCCYYVTFDYNRAGYYLFNSLTSDENVLSSFDSALNLKYYRFVNGVIGNTVLSCDGKQIIYRLDKSLYWKDFYSNRRLGSTLDSIYGKLVSSPVDDKIIKYTSDTLLVYDNVSRKLIKRVKFVRDIDDVSFAQNGDLAVACDSAVYIFRNLNFKKTYKHFILKDYGCCGMSIAIINDKLFCFNDTKLWKVDLKTKKESLLDFKGEKLYSSYSFAKPNNDMLLFYSQYSGENMYIISEKGAVSRYKVPVGYINCAEIVNEKNIMISTNSRCYVIPIKAFVPVGEHEDLDYIYYKLKAISK